MREVSPFSASIRRESGQSCSVCNAGASVTVFVHPKRMWSRGQDRLVRFRLPSTHFRFCASCARRIGAVGKRIKNRASVRGG